MSDDTTEYSNYTVEQLRDKIKDLRIARELAENLGTGTRGVDNMIEAGMRELLNRDNIVVSEEELIVYTRVLEANGKLVEDGPIADKQKDAPGSTNGIPRR